jgi:hypothetical protein
MFRSSMLVVLLLGVLGVGLGCGPLGMSDGAGESESNESSGETSAVGTDTDETSTVETGDGDGDGDGDPGPELVLLTMRTDAEPSIHSVYLMDLAADDPMATLSEVVEAQWYPYASRDDGVTLMHNPDDELLLLDVRAEPPQLHPIVLAEGLTADGGKWISDGSELLVHTRELDGLDRLWRVAVDADGVPAQPQLVTEFPELVRIDFAQPGATPPVLSEDGGTLAVSGYEFGGLPGFDTRLYVVALDEPQPIPVEVAQLTTLSEGEPEARNLHLSPDGGELVFLSYPTDFDVMVDSQLWFVDIDTGAPPQAVLPDLPCDSVQWIDPYTVLYHEGFGLDPWIIEIGEDGPGAAQLVETGLTPMWPYLVHGGARILFVSRDVGEEVGSLYSLELQPSPGQAEPLAGTVLGQTPVFNIRSGQNVDDGEMVLLVNKYAHQDLEFHLLRWSEGELVEQRVLADSIDDHPLWSKFGEHAYVWTQQAMQRQMWALHFGNPDAVAAPRSPILDYGDDVPDFLLADQDGRHVLYLQDGYSVLVDGTMPNVAIPLAPGGRLTTSRPYLVP